MIHKNSLTYMCVFFAILIGFLLCGAGIDQVRRTRSSRRSQRRFRHDSAGGNLMSNFSSVGGI